MLTSIYISYSNINWKKSHYGIFSSKYTFFFIYFRYCLLSDLLWGLIKCLHTDISLIEVCVFIIFQNVLTITRYGIISATLCRYSIEPNQLSHRSIFINFHLRHCKWFFVGFDFGYSIE